MLRSRPMLRSSLAWIAVLAALVLGPGMAGAGVFDPVTFRLANGLDVVVIEDHRAPVVVHMVWYRVGAADSPEGKSGIAHFFEHLMFKGTREMAPGTFSKTVARNGGRDNAFTAQDYTGYFQTVARDRLELMMRLEADRMANLVLADEVVLPERAVVQEERASRTDNEPAAILREQMSAAQYLNHPYGRPIIGWGHEIAGLSTADALAFYRAHYAPNNAILIVAGDVAAAEVRTLAERYYGPVPARELAPRRRPQEPPQLAARRVVLEHAGVRQPSVNRSYLAPSRSAGEKQHALALTVLAEILGGGPTARMHQAMVRNNGVASAAGAWYDSVSLDQSTFGLYATPQPGGTIEKVEAALDEVLARLLAEGVTPEEVGRAKTGLLAAAVYARDSLFGAARTFGAALTSGLSVEDIETWPEQVKAVTVEQVNAAARHVLDPRRSVTGLLRPRPAS